jgi:MoaA/NifB/PqqE/SkfB family radical SAM enzyme
MKAQTKPRIDLHTRTKLETVIPLSAPFILFVDPSDMCNFQCKFCPTGDKALMRNTTGRNHGIMDLDLYRKIINDLSEFERPLKVLRLYKDGEPLLHPHLGEMIRYAKARQCANRIDTTTNAALLTPARSLELIDAGLDRLNISMEGMSAKQYYDFSRVTIDFDKLTDQVAFFYEHRQQCEVLVKINGDLLTSDEQQKFLDVFGEIADYIFIEHIAPCWPVFALRDVQVNKDFGIYGQPLDEVIVCPYPFYSFSINSDGSASLCFLDWARRLSIGDAKQNTIKEIWEGRSLYEYRKMFLEKRREAHPVCGNCGQMRYGLPDNIDSYAAELLHKIQTP